MKNENIKIGLLIVVFLLMITIGFFNIHYINKRTIGGDKFCELNGKLRGTDIIADKFGGLSYEGGILTFSCKDDKNTAFKYFDVVSREQKAIEEYCKNGEN